MKLASGSKILVCDFRRIGDGVMGLAMFEAIKKRYSDSYTIFLCEKSVANLAANNPFIDLVLSFDPSSKIAVLRLLFKLLKLKADVAIDNLGMPKSAIACLLSRAKIRLGIRQNLRFFYTHMYTDKIDCAYSAHQKMHTLKLIDAFPAKPLPLPFIALNQDIKRDISKRLNLINLQNFITSSPASKISKALWSAQKWARLYEMVYEKFALKTLLIYAPNEKDRIDEILKFLTNPDCVVADFTFDNLQQIANILAFSKLHISQDSGIKHIANTQKTPCITLRSLNADLKNWQVPSANVIDIYLDTYENGQINPEIISVDEFFEHICKVFSKTDLDQ